MNKIVFWGRISGIITGQVRGNKMVHMQLSKHFEVITCSFIGRFSWLTSLFLCFYNIIAKKPKFIYGVLSTSSLGLLVGSLIISASASLGVKPIFHIRSSNLLVRSRLTYIDKFSLYLLNKHDIVLIVLSEKFRDEYYKIFGPRVRLEVLRNSAGTDFEHFSDNTKVSSDTHDQVFRILYLSNLIESKGYIEVCEATMKLLNENFPIQLRLVGSPFGVNLEKLEEKFSKYKEVEFLGSTKSVEDVTNVIRWADFIILPTTYKTEAQPRCVVESFCFGKPVITSRHADLPHMFDDGVHGVLLDGVDCAGIVSGLKRAKQLFDMGYFDSDIIMKHYDQHYSTKSHNEKLNKIFGV